MSQIQHRRSLLLRHQFNPFGVEFLKINLCQSENGFWYSYLSYLVLRILRIFIPFVTKFSKKNSLESNFYFFTLYIKTNISLEEDSISSSEWFKEFDGEFESLTLQIPRLRAAAENFLTWWKFCQKVKLKTKSLKMEFFFRVLVAAQRRK